MKRFHPAIGCGAIVVFAMATARAVPDTSGDTDTAIQAALDEVVAQCPEAYPEVDTRLPEPGGFSNKTDAELLGMLDVWNPALRTYAAGELGRRGKQALPTLIAGLSSVDAARRLGALNALGPVVEHQIRNCQEIRPGESNPRQAQENIQREFSDLLLVRVLSLADDPDPSVRGGVLSMLSSLNAWGPEISLAVLKLCIDDDDYLADQACIALEKQFHLGGLDTETAVPYLRQAMKNPLPRGKGHLVRLISRSDESLQRVLVPDLLAHLDWQPDRDTMFGGGGQSDAVQLLTKLRVQELLPRLTGLMDKPMRGAGLFDDCIASLKAFGPDARPILPELKQKLAEMETELGALSSRNDRSSRARAAQLEQRITALKQTIQHVES